MIQASRYVLIRAPWGHVTLKGGWTGRDLYSLKVTRRERPVVNELQVEFYSTVQRKGREGVHVGIKERVKSQHMWSNTHTFSVL